MKKKKSAMIKHDHIDPDCCPRQRLWKSQSVIDFLWFCNVDNDKYYRLRMWIMVNENKLVPTNVFVVNFSNYIFPSLIVLKKKCFWIHDSQL